MGFTPGTGGGSSSLAGSTDVALNGVQDNQLLGYNSTSSKWQNRAATVPVNGVLATSGTIRPSTDPTITVIFKGNDPGSNALNGDIWLGAS